MKYYITDNCATAVELKDIPEVEYAALYEDLKERLQEEHYHVAHYFARTEENRLKFYLILLDDKEQKIMISSFQKAITRIQIRKNLSIRAREAIPLQALPSW